MDEIYEQLKKMSAKDMTAAFNSLEVEDRIRLLDSLAADVREEFVTKIRKQAVADFWTHERELIEQGQSTRDWTPEQIEEIMKISEKTGKESVNGAVAYDINGKSYYGHHMLDVSIHPEYAGDWRNIQALDYDEHYYGAHKGHDTKEPTYGYYDVETKEMIVIEIPEGGVDFDNLGYPPKTTCIFKSNEEIKKLYNTGEKVTDGELLALKNLELSTSENGSLTDFERCLDVAERYQCSDFEIKYGIMSESDVTNRYAFWENMTYQDKLAFRAYEYYKSKDVDTSCIEKLGIPSDTQLMQKYNFADIGDSGMDMLRAYEYQYRGYGAIPDTKVFFDENGDIIGLSHFDSSLSEKSTYEIALSEAANYQSDGDMLFKYADYNSYSELDKIKASQYDYERRFIASMMEEEIVGKDGMNALEDSFARVYILQLTLINKYLSAYRYVKTFFIYL